MYECGLAYAVQKITCLGCTIDRSLLISSRHSVGKVLHEKKLCRGDFLFSVSSFWEPLLELEIGSTEQIETHFYCFCLTQNPTLRLWSELVAITQKEINSVDSSRDNCQRVPFASERINALPSGPLVRHEFCAI